MADTLSGFMQHIGSRLHYLKPTGET